MKRKFSEIISMRLHKVHLSTLHYPLVTNTGSESIMMHVESTAFDECTAYNDKGVYNDESIAYNDESTAYNDESTTYNDESTAYNGQCTE